MFICGMNNFFKGVIFGVLLSCVVLFLFFKIFDTEDQLTVNLDAKNKIIIVDKQNQKLTIYDAFFGPIKTFDVSTGENVGNKLMKGDLKTPEGIFPVIGIEDASDWTYDFKDGKGETPGAYGPLFIRLKVDSHTIFENVSTNFEFTSGNEFTGIGIHGTHLNNLIGSRASHGCIRLRNEDLNELRQYIEPGTLVAIIPGRPDMEENLKPKNIN
jgi:lipoprotein-anchoring transpeptidase ErfK/SrfK